MTSRFVHLHVHTSYSLLDGAIRIDDLIDSMRETQMESVAITDHGNMFGTVEFYTKLTKAGLKPILGCEMYITPQDRRDTSKRLAYHLVLLAETYEGYKNLVRLSSRAYLEGFYYNPRIDYELLKQYHSGLIGLSACLAGEIPSAILEGQTQKAREIASRYASIFGKDNFYLEIQRNGTKDQDVVNAELLKISKELDLPLIATNDSHYLKKEDKRAHEVLLCLQTRKTINDPDRFSYESDQLYFRSPDEMIPLFEEFPDAVQNTLAIANRCHVKLDLDKPVLPKYAVPPDQSLDSYLSLMANEGLETRLRQMSYPVDPALYKERLDEELKIIINMGFSGYFLIVWDFIKYAHEQCIPVGPGRGSGAGSLVAYSLRITDLDPIPYNLLFERFLNPERVSMPDFDIDFCMNRRDEVIDYVSEKYGRDCVGQIVTFSCMKAKAAIRDVGRVLDVPRMEVDKMAKLVPDDLNITLADAIKKEPRLQEMVNSDDRYKEIFEIALRLEGLNRHAGVHAAGVVISEQPLWETVPVKKENTEFLVTQFAKDEVEKAGLVKFDFLGLKTLTIIDLAEKLINQRLKSQGQSEFRIREQHLNDPEVYKLISTGELFGVFQMEGSGFQEMIKKMQPSCFEDIIAAVALYRPGPMSIIPDFIARKHGQEAIEYPHSSLETVLKDTYGLIVYQEQVMQISRIMAGFSLGYADILRRAMGKKKPEEMARMRTIFIKGDKDKGIPGALKLNYNERLAGDVFDLMEKFAGYGFNKSHAAGYALLAYQTAYLKQYYPREFMTSIMTCDRESTDKIVKAISECRNMNIPVLPPDINISESDFTIHQDSIRFGLAAVKNVGEPAVRAILAVRNEEGPFCSIFDVCNRVDLRAVNRRVIESLIKCGALDGLGVYRSQMTAVIDRALDAGQSTQRDRQSGQVSLFQVLDASESKNFTQSSFPDMDEWPVQTMLSHEKEMLGFYVTGHPLLHYKDEFKSFVTHDSQRLNESLDGDPVVMAGIVANVKRFTTTKKKEQMAFVTLEDLSGLCEMVVRAQEWSARRDILDEDRIVVVEGFSSVNESQVRIVASKIMTVAEARYKFTHQAIIRLAANEANSEVLNRLKETFCRYKGNIPVQMIVEFDNQSVLESVILDLGRDYRIDPDEEFAEAIRGLAAVRSCTFR